MADEKKNIVQDKEALKGFFGRLYPEPGCEKVI